MIVLPESLRGCIVQFHIYSSGQVSMDGNHVLLVSEIGSEFVYGGFIAGELIPDDKRGTLSLSNCMKGYHRGTLSPCSETRIWRLLITSYQILTVRDLPLLLGYKYTGDLLADLIKGE